MDLSDGRDRWWLVKLLLRDWPYGGCLFLLIVFAFVVLMTLWEPS